jgi:hypothetical protein
MDAMSYAIGVEEISRGCAGCGVIMSVSQEPLKWCGTPLPY